MHTRLFRSLSLSLLCLLLAYANAYAQVPDTTYRKPELPTGPPVPVTQPTPQPKVQEQPKPQPQFEPEVVQQQDEEVYEDELRFIDKLYFGGSLGLQFGTYTSISLMPTISYALTPKVYLGLGGVYHYESGNGVSFNHYGARGYAQLEMFNIGDGAVLAHAEVEALSLEYYPRFSNEKERMSLTMPLIGLGYRQRLSSKASFDLLLLYNTNEDDLAPYSNPIIRAGFNIPFTRR